MRNDHRSKRDPKIWDDFIALVKQDVATETACEYVGIGKSTIYRRMEADSNLKDQYYRAKNFVDVIVSQEINKILFQRDEQGNPVNLKNEERIKYFFERKKRRDKRRSEKIDQKIIPVIIDENELEE